MRLHGTVSQKAVIFILSLVDGFFVDLTMKYVHVTVRKELYKDARVHQACWNAASVMFLYIFTSAVHATEYKYHFNPLKLI
jgi:hypothetical protein